MIIRLDVGGRGCDHFFLMPDNKWEQCGWAPFIGWIPLRYAYQDSNGWFLVVYA